MLDMPPPPASPGTPEDSDAGGTGPRPRRPYGALVDVDGGALLRSLSRVKPWEAAAAAAGGGGDEYQMLTATPSPNAPSLPSAVAARGRAWRVLFPE